MTPEQRIAALRFEKHILREQLCPVMNDTKWRETVQILQGMVGYQLRVRVKCVQSPEIADWTGSWPLPQPYKTIEWLDICPIV